MIVFSPNASASVCVCVPNDTTVLSEIKFCKNIEYILPKIPSQRGVYIACDIALHIDRLL